MMVRTIAAALALLACPAFGAPGSVSTPVLDAFRVPPVSARPMLRWWWPGGMVEDSTIVSELDAFAAAGYGGVEIQPMRGGLGKLTSAGTARVNDYASARFFGHIAVAAAAAGARGMALDLTLGSGWPSGGGEPITPELAQVELRAAQLALSGPRHYRGPVPAIDSFRFAGGKRSPPLEGQGTSVAWDARLVARGTRVAVLAIKGTPALDQRRAGGPNDFYPVGIETLAPGQLDMDTVVDLTDKVGPDGQLDWEVPAGDWVLFNFERIAAGVKVALSVGTGPQLVLDHFNPAAVRAHVKRVLEQGAPLLKPLLGRGLRSVFVDSFELPVEHYWSDEFLAEFQARRGYSLRPLLPLMLRHQWMAPYAEAAGKPQYTTVAGSRVEEDYQRTVGELFTEGFLLPARDAIHAQGYTLRMQAHGGPTDLIAAYGLADIPETEDLFQKGRPEFLAAARSAADIYGKSVVASESLIVLGHPTDATPTMWKARADTLLANGANQIIMHGAAYPARDPQGAGWLPFGAVFGSSFNPRNPVFSGLRPLNDYLARVQAVMQATRTVAPVAIYRDALLFQDHGDGGFGSPSPMNVLQRAGYTADWLSADALLKSRVEGHALVMPSGHRFEAVIIDQRRPLRPETAQRLAQLSAAGVLVIEQGGDPLAAMAGRVAPNLAFAGSWRPDYLDKTDGVRRIVFVSNPGDQAQTLRFRPPVTGLAECWIPWTGAIERLERDADGMLSRTLAPHETVFIVIDPSRPAIRSGATGALKPTRRTVKRLDSGWTMRFKGYGPASVALVRDFEAAEPGDWRAIPALAQASGSGHYRTSFNGGSVREIKGGRVLLDLGKVGDVASITLNGCTARLPVAPFVVDVSAALRRGRNDLDVDISNTFHNALSGSTTDGVTYYAASAPAGLIGPVTLATASIDDRGVTHIDCPSRVTGPLPAP
jgi:hypothetical protein